MVILNKIILPKDESASTFQRSRIVRIEAAGSLEVWLFVMEGTPHIPQLRPISEIHKELDQDLIQLIDWSPKTVLLNRDDITAGSKASQLAALDTLAAIRQHSPDLSLLFNRATRGKIIAAVANKRGMDRKDVYSVLYRWWRNGMTDAALIPTRGLSSEGREAKEGQLRRGRKGDCTHRFALTDEVKSIVEATIRKYAK